MFTWSRKEKSSANTGKDPQPLSLLQLARSHTTSHVQWMAQAIQEFRKLEVVDRAGVWLDGGAGAAGAHASASVFRGEVWDREAGEGPPEWTRLSEDLPLPGELLKEGKSCEYELQGSHGVILGPLVGLSRVLWVPISAQRMLRGILLLGSRQKQAALPRVEAERIAEELGLLLEWEDWRQLAAGRKADLELDNRVRKLLREGQSGPMILAQLAESCTRTVPLGGVGSVFALLGERRATAEKCSGAGGAERERLVVRAQSGELQWAQRAKAGALESFWREAVTHGKVMGADAEEVLESKEKLRVVAIPLGPESDVYGALLAALPRRQATLENLERLEVRAMLAREVLEKERQREAEAQRERWQQALLEASGEPLVVVDEKGAMRGISHAARRIFDEELVSGGASLALADFFEPREAVRVRQWLKEAGEAGAQATRLQSELRTGRPVALAKIAIFGGRFRAVRIESVAAAKSAAKVEEVEEQLRQSIEWLEEGVVVFDAGGEIHAHNRRFLQILGLSEKQGNAARDLEDLIRECAGNFAAPELFAAEWRALGRVGVSGTQEELAMEKPVPQVIERSTRTILAADGKNLGRVEVYREATARRMFQSRMLQAEKLASLGQRVTGIVHELSNPLTSILGNAQRMVLRGAAGAQSGEAHRILEEAERATAILRQLLNYSRETRAERRLLSLNELVQHAVELQRASMSPGSLLIHVDSAEHLPRVAGDAGQLQQVLLNLLQNAQQAIEISGRGSMVGVRTAAVAHERIRLEVWDDGPGIPEPIQARIFDPFFTTKPEGMGTGLGLAIVNGFVRQHGGSIGVHCPPEGGTRFVIELPAAEEVRDPESSANGEARQSLHGGAARNLCKQDVPPGWESVPHILVVEDEATVANLIADVLRDEGMKVEVQLDSQGALQAAGHKLYDLVICDLKMPGMDGQVFYERLQQHGNPLREHMLFVTGDVVSPRTHEFLERNRLAHLAKPFRVEELSEAVRRMLWGGGARAAIAGAKSSEAVRDGVRP